MLGFVVVLAIAVAGIAAASPARADDAPDIVYFNGKIVTMDAADSIAEAVAIKDGKFVAVGTTDAMRAMSKASTTLVDLEGRTTVPGLIDAHTHPLETMVMKGWVDGRFPGTASVSQLLGKIADAAKAAPKGGWVFVACSSASQDKFAEKRLPTLAELDAAAPDNPVAIANGTHMFLGNSMALKELGVTSGHVALTGGGHALLGPDGQPNGVLVDGGAALPSMPTAEMLKQYYAKDIPAFWNSNGFTSVLAITPAYALPALQAVAKAGTTDIRYTTSVWTAMNDVGMPTALGSFAMPAGADPDYYRSLGIKIWMDGENDARTGLMYEPYLGHDETDPPGDMGVLTSSPDQIQSFTDIAAKNGVTAMIHCSGDKAVDLCLDAYEREVANGATNVMRIEHFGMFQLNDKQLERAKALRQHRFFVSIQPTWLLDLVKSDYASMGEARASTGFRFRDLIEAGLEPAAGTDVTGIYLTNVNPMLAIYAAVSRNSDMGIFQADQAVSVRDAVRMWTIWAAKSMAEEGSKGSIEPGKLADMTILSGDILTIPPESLKNVTVVKTIVGGRVVYDAAAAR
ncbi:MAG TPA: amidohydrolase [Bauldia sp.]|nr:amidohydrolase [Bauldia sp.]